MQVTKVDFSAFQEKMKSVYEQFSPKYPELFSMIVGKNP